jgi:hypothetical protein
MRKSSAFTFRVTDELKEKLVIAAEHSGRTMSEEAAFRLWVMSLPYPLWCAVIANSELWEGNRKANRKRKRK